MWSVAYKRGHVTYNNNTNNPVETVNNVLKKWVKRSSTMYACIEGILNYIEALKTKSSYKTYLEW